MRAMIRANPSKRMIMRPVDNLGNTLKINSNRLFSSTTILIVPKGLTPKMKIMRFRTTLKFAKRI